MSTREHPLLELVVVADAVTTPHPLPSHGSVAIGRGDQNAIRLLDLSVSRSHAVLHLELPLRIEDVGSANGLRVTVRRGSEGQTARLTERHVPPGGSSAVSLGDLIHIGTTVLYVRAADRSEQDSPSSSRRIRSLATPVVHDRAMVQLYETAVLVAQSALNVLLLGETGVGKEVMAETIHNRSPRARGPLVGLNCAALSESLLESELFGHEAGSFTGAAKAKPGLFETAEGGTIFLDEAGDLPKSVQVKLLRVIEERKVLRVGGVTKRAIDVRFISATNRDLKAAVRQSLFREDLYFRLNGMSITIPPLRQRVSEIEPLARTFISCFAGQMTLRAEPSLSEEALDALRSYPWPGNIRELRNVIERAVVLSAGGMIQPAHLGLSAKIPSVPPSPLARPEAITIPPITPLRTKSGEIERLRIIEALERCGGNQTDAAELLGISRRTLLSRLDLYAISRPRKKE